jgi:hypothetical protein
MPVNLQGNSVCVNATVAFSSFTQAVTKNLFGGHILLELFIDTNCASSQSCAVELSNARSCHAEGGPPLYRSFRYTVDSAFQPPPPPPPPQKVPVAIGSLYWAEPDARSHEVVAWGWGQDPCEGGAVLAYDNRYTNPCGIEMPDNL